MHVHGEADILRITLNTPLKVHRLQDPRLGVKRLFVPDARFCQWRNFPQTITVVPQQLFP